MVQAFLAFDDSFAVLLSTPMVRHFDEQFLTNRFTDYRYLAEDSNPHPRSGYAELAEHGVPGMALGSI